MFETLIIKKEVVQMALPSVKEVEARLGGNPGFVKNRFGIDSRSVTEDGEWKAICRDCFYTFPVHTTWLFICKLSRIFPIGSKFPLPRKHRGVTIDFQAVPRFGSRCILYPLTVIANFRAIIFRIV